MDGGPGSYQGRLSSVQKGFAEVAQGIALLDDLMRELNSTKSLLAQTKLDLDSECQTRRRLQQGIQDHKGQVERPFVVVLIDADADCYVFRDEFLTQGERGGEKAADALLKALWPFVKDTIQLDGAAIVAKAFANVDGLGSALQRHGRLAHKDEFRSFVAGFNNRKVFFDFVDVGSGKERADTKIKENIKFYLDSFQCKHLVLACGHDDGYAPWLGQFVGDSQVAGRITLVEGQPFPVRMRQLGLRRIRLSSVFGDGSWTNYPVVSAPITPASVAGTVPAPPSGPAIMVSGGSGSSVKGGNAPEPKKAKDNSSQAAVAGINPQAQSQRLGPVLTDKNGRRVDRVLKVTKEDAELVRKAKLCSYYYLRGMCLVKCQRNHQFVPLSDGEFDALWELSRHGKCDKSKRSAKVGGPDCSDPLCVYGHGIASAKTSQSGDKKDGESG